jgi:RNA polymerase sigma-70 factor (ECF subfamily)
MGTTAKYLAYSQAPSDKTLLALQKVLRWHVRVILWRLLNKTRHNIDELVEDTVTHILANLEAFKGESNFSTWAFRIAHNQGVSYLRKAHATCSIDDLELAFPDTEQALNAQITCDQIEALLTEREAKLFHWLREGLSAKDMGDQLGVGRKQIERSLVKLKAKIRRLCGEVSEQV